MISFIAKILFYHVKTVHIKPLKHTQIQYVFMRNVIVNMALSSHVMAASSDIK